MDDSRGTQLLMRTPMLDQDDQHFGDFGLWVLWRVELETLISVFHPVRILNNKKRGLIKSGILFVFNRMATA